MTGQVEDRVADELAGPVVGGLPAAVDLDDVDLRAFGDVHLPLLGAPAERDRRRVLEEEHRVGQRAVGDAGRGRPLQLERLAVVDGAEVDEVRRSSNRFRPRPAGARAGRAGSGRRSAPSTSRWSYVSVRFMIERIAIASAPFSSVITHGRFTIA